MLEYDTNYNVRQQQGVPLAVIAAIFKHTAGLIKLGQSSTGTPTVEENRKVRPALGRVN